MERRGEGGTPQIRDEGGKFYVIGYFHPIIREVGEGGSSELYRGCALVDQGFVVICGDHRARKKRRENVQKV